MNKIANTQEYAMGYDELLNNSEKLAQDVDQLLVKASNTTYEGRTFTYARGGPGGWLDYKQAAEIAWVALYQVIDVLLHKNNITSQHGGRHEHDREMPTKPILGNYDRKLALMKLEKTNADLASKHYYDRYVSITAGLRNNSNYYTKQDIELVKWEVARVKEIINEVKSL
mgnify:CR=1 FL=1